jgi:hypothetical protein
MRASQGLTFSLPLLVTVRSLLSESSFLSEKVSLTHDTFNGLATQHIQYIHFCVDKNLLVLYCAVTFHAGMAYQHISRIYRSARLRETRSFLFASPTVRHPT